jgi:polysaccharide chain length determinant protein (PEP-CTERM system associated)
MNSAEISKYIDMAVKRKYWIIIPFLLVMLAGLVYLLKTPKTFEASTLIMVQEQKVPDSFVQSIVSTSIEDRLRTITQQVTSRTNLEIIIEEYDLYEDRSERDMLMEQKVEVLREWIDIDVSRGGGGGHTFSISFRGRDPETVKRVTNTLASNFISENLRVRESQAIGTSSFLADELDSITRKLAEKEEQLKNYSMKYMGALPDQLQTNLNVLGRLQMQMEQLNSNLNSAETRKLIVQQQIADYEELQRQITERAATPSPPVPARPSLVSTPEENEDLASLKRTLISLKGRYTDNHPDVVRVKQMIATLEAEEQQKAIEEEEREQDIGVSLPSEETSEASVPPVQVVDSTLLTQLNQIVLEIANIKTEILNVQSRMEMYQKRVEDTPKREQELLGITRDYENLKALHNSMLNRKLEAEIAVSMERKQKGEQFTVIDSAKTPVLPIAPDARKVLLMTIALGLGLGCGLAYLLEYMDTSYKTPEELEQDLQIPILASLPFRYTEKEARANKRVQILAAVSIAAAFVLSAAAIILAIKGLDTTLSYINRILGTT